MVMVVARQQGGFTFVLCVAALMTICVDVQEAASIGWCQPMAYLFRIRIPLISPMIPSVLVFIFAQRNVIAAVTAGSSR